jgi:hypothetical protein
MIYLRCVMQDKDYNKQHHPNLFPSMDPLDRRHKDRRKQTGEGYTYISMVGWICRREHRRRNCDCKKICVDESKSTH